MKDLKLKELEKSLEYGIITQEEYEKKKHEIESMPEKEKVQEEIKEESHETKLKSDRILVIGIILLVLFFALVFGYAYFNKKSPQTLDELHALNLKGKLNADQGFMYQGVYSFVKFDNLWYTQFKSPKGSRLYNVQFRFSPKEVEDIAIHGKLNSSIFDNATSYYATFDPKGNDFSHVALAVGDFNQHMTNIFFKQPIAACDKNGTFDCKNRPIITCDNTQELVLYVKESNKSDVYYDNNCIVVEGKGFDLVKEIDRVLYDFYEIIK